MYYFEGNDTLSFDRWTTDTENVSSNRKKEKREKKREGKEEREKGTSRS